jgi:hypothetical protein
MGIQKMARLEASEVAFGELRTEFTTLLQRCNTLLTELSTLHATEAALPR